MRMPGRRVTDGTKRRRDRCVESRGRGTADWHCWEPGFGEDLRVEDDANAAVLRNGLTDWLLRNGVVQTPQVEAAMRAVPRHLLVPQASVEAAYEHRSVITRRDKAGIAVSSASEPGIVARMLGAAGCAPGASCPGDRRGHRLQRRPAGAPGRPGRAICRRPGVSS